MLSLTNYSVCSRVCTRRTPTPVVAAPRFSRGRQVAVRAQDVTVVYNGHQEKVKLINNKIHVDTIKQLFQLQTVKLNGLIEPVGRDGLTMTAFDAETPVNVTGLAARDLAALCNEMSVLRDEIKTMSHLRSDVTAIKRLVAEITWKTVSSSQDEAIDLQCGSSKASMDMARDIINSTTKVDIRSPSPMDDMMADMHAH